MEPVINRVDESKLIKDLSNVSDVTKGLILKNISNKHIVQIHNISNYDGDIKNPNISPSSDFKITEIHENSRDETLEIPCFDIIPPDNKDAMRILKCCVSNKLHDQCAKAFLGSWNDRDNVEIIQIGGGLSNYLFCAYLKPECIANSEGTPTKVLIRVYGEVLRNNADWVVLESIIFALLSEKQIGPTLYGLFPGGRIEQYIDSRPLRTSEISLPVVSACIAKKLARLHSLSMPLVKKPDYIISTLGRYLSQLKDSSHFPKRPTSWSSIPDLSVESLPHDTHHSNLESDQSASNRSYNDNIKNINHCLDIPVKYDVRSQKPDLNDKSTKPTASNPLLARCEKCSEQKDVLTQSKISESHKNSIYLLENILQEQVSQILSKYQIINEFEWLKDRLTNKFATLFPVVFCHNDFQESLFSKPGSTLLRYNILVVPDKTESGKISLLPIDFEYCSYNFRGFDIGNHFNEWCHDYSNDQEGNGFITHTEKYPTEEKQLYFFSHYLSAYYSLISGSEPITDKLYFDSHPDDLYESLDVNLPTNLAALHNLRCVKTKDSLGLVDNQIFLDALPLTDWEKDPRNLLLEAYAKVRLNLYHQMKKDYEKHESHLDLGIKK